MIEVNNKFKKHKTILLILLLLNVAYATIITYTFNTSTQKYTEGVRLGNKRW